MSVDTILSSAFLIAALACLGVGLWTWRAGGKHLVLSSLILTAVSASMVLPEGSGRKVTAMSIAGGLIVAALMTTPGAQVRRMRAELMLFTAAIVVIWVLDQFALARSVAVSGLVLLAVVMVCAFGALIWRAKSKGDAK